MPQMMLADFIALPCASNLQMRLVSAASSSDLRPRVSFFTWRFSSSCCCELFPCRFDLGGALACQLRQTLDVIAQPLFVNIDCALENLAKNRVFFCDLHAHRQIVEIECHRLGSLPFVELNQPGFVLVLLHECRLRFQTFFTGKVERILFVLGSCVSQLAKFLSAFALITLFVEKGI